MTRKELENALLGLFAYDEGATDSGIHDETLREMCVQRIESMSDEEFRTELSIIVRDAFLIPSAMEQGYGIEDVASFIRWLDNEMGVVI